MTAAELKASILDRAVHGLLVPQDPNDAPAAEPSPIDNPPYELPRGWVWKRLGDICTKIVDGDHNPPKGIEKPTKYLMLSSRNINNGKLVDLSNVRYLTKEIFDIEDQRTCARNGDILFTSVGSLGRSCVFDGSLNICFQRSVSVLTTSAYNYYLKYFFDSPFFQFKVKTEATGTAQKGFYLNQLEAALIPLPPLAEQKRIVAKIEELMPLVEEYGKAETELAALNDNFPTALRKSILQHAVEGRLTARWRKEVEVEESAAELLAKIAAEKKHLLAEGKIKKQKPLPPITDDEKPFPTPDGWEWARIGDIAKVISKGTTPSGGATAYVSQGITFIRSENITSNHTLELSQAKRITKAVHENELSRSILESGDLLVCIAGSLGKVGYVRQQDLPANTNQAVCFTRLNHNAKACLPYLVHLLSSESMQRSMLVQKKNTGVPNLTLEIIANLPIPLPPLAEQKAIVERVEELLGLVEKMKE